jgi:hypothetical protein
MDIRRAASCSDCLGVLRTVQKTSKSNQWRLLAPIAQRYSQRQLSTRTAPQLGQYRKTTQTPQRQWTRQYAAPASPKATTPSPSDLNAIHKRVQELAASVLKPQDGPVPPEQRVLYVFEQLDSLAKSLVDAKTINATSHNQHSKHADTATSALLGSVNARQAPSSVTKAALLTLISQKAEETMRHANIFITPAILKSYTDLQTLLHQPSSFPDVFSLYANKPIPIASSDSSVSFSPAAPDKMNTAIDPKTANAAHSAAITARHLSAKPKSSARRSCPLVVSRSLL